MSTITEARALLQRVREAVEFAAPMPWSVVKDRWGDVDVHDAQRYQIRTDGDYAQSAGEMDEGAAFLIVLLAGNPALLDAIDGMLADAAYIKNEGITGAYATAVHAERIATALVQQGTAMGIVQPTPEVEPFNSADLCRDRGWIPGTRLVGDEGFGPTVIEITAVGEQSILTKTISPTPRREGVWTLEYRDWQPTPKGTNE